jgi:polyisoprenoid-binding protein YceI
VIKRTIPCVLLVLLAFVASYGAVTRYDVDTAHSTIGFSVPILGGLSTVSGKFSDFKADIVYDDRDVTKSSVNAVIKAASINTGIERRDAHLRNPDFFEVEKYPEITFQSKSIEKKGKQLIAHGTFTMHGVSKEIALPFTINGVQPAKDGKTVLGITARTVINRRDYNINYSRQDNPTFLGDNIEIVLSLSTRAAAPAGSAAPATAK